MANPDEDLEGQEYQIYRLFRHSRVGGNPVLAFAMAAQVKLDTRLRGYDGIFDIPTSLKQMGCVAALNNTDKHIDNLTVLVVCWYSL